MYKITNHRNDIIGIYDSKGELYQLKPKRTCTIDKVPVNVVGLMIEKEIDGKMVPVNYAEEVKKIKEEIMRKEVEQNKKEEELMKQMFTEKKIEKKPVKVIPSKEVIKDIKETKKVKVI